MGAVSKHIFLVTDPLLLESTIRSAFELAKTGRPGPVVVDIPKDIQNWEGEFLGSGSLPLTGYRNRLETVMNNNLNDELAKNFYKLLNKSKKPLIYAGGGVINADASSQLRQFSETYKIPIVTTLMALGIVTF